MQASEQASQPPIAHIAMQTPTRHLLTIHKIIARCTSETQAHASSRKAGNKPTDTIPPQKKSWKFSLSGKDSPQCRCRIQRTGLFVLARLRCASVHVHPSVAPLEWQELDEQAAAIRAQGMCAMS